MRVRVRVRREAEAEAEAEGEGEKELAAVPWSRRAATPPAVALLAVTLPAIALPPIRYDRTTPRPLMDVWTPSLCLHERIGTQAVRTCTSHGEVRGWASALFVGACAPLHVEEKPLSSTPG